MVPARTALSDPVLASWWWSYPESNRMQISAGKRDMPFLPTMNGARATAPFYYHFVEEIIGRCTERQRRRRNISQRNFRAQDHKGSCSCPDLLWHLNGCGGRIRTFDLQVMGLTSCLCSTPPCPDAGVWVTASVLPKNIPTKRHCLSKRI